MPRYQTQPAVASDIADIIAIKQSLPPSEYGGGFILGSSYELYIKYIESGICRALKRDSRLIGYTICLPDAVLRRSELWQKKEHIDFSMPIAPIIRDKIAYFEQLAILPNYRYHLAKLLLPTMDACFEQHKHMFTTCVCEPFANTATQRLYSRVAAKPVAKLREFYPEHGRITSQVYYLSQANYFAAKHKLSVVSRNRHQANTLCL